MAQVFRARISDSGLGRRRWIARVSTGYGSPSGMEAEMPSLMTFIPLHFHRSSLLLAQLRLMLWPAVPVYAT